MRSSRVLRTASRSMSSGFVGVGSSTGQIALRNAQQKSVTFSTSLTETAPRVLSLQRDFLRSVAWIKRAYGVQLPESVREIGSRLRAVTPARARPEMGTGSLTALALPPVLSRYLSLLVLSRAQEMRSLLTQAFRAKKNTAEIHTINRLIVQGRMELEETLMLWKGPSHVNNWFEAATASKTKDAKPATFLDNFFAGKPAAK